MCLISIGFLVAKNIYLCKGKKDNNIGIKKPCFAINPNPSKTYTN